MNKWQAINAFWNSFEIPAYDENSIPETASMPYITYSATISGFEAPVTLTASLWYRQTSWQNISLKADEIARYIGHAYKTIKLDDGYMVITQGNTFAQRMSDEDDSIKRIYLMIDVEFYTQS